MSVLAHWMMYTQNMRGWSPPPTGLSLLSSVSITSHFLTDSDTCRLDISIAFHSCHLLSFDHSGVPDGIVSFDSPENA